MIEMFEWKECDFIDGPAGGCLGGRKIFACPKDGTDRRFVVKYEEYGQSLNELVAQCLLKETGLSSLSTAWINPFDDDLADREGRWYGALEYIPCLARLNLEDLTQENNCPIEDYFKHLVMGDCIFNNVEEIEIYKDLDGTVYSLDYGEIDISETILKVMRRQGRLSKDQAAAFDKVVLNSLSNITLDSIMNPYLQITENILESVKGADPDCLKATAKDVFRAFAEISKDKIGDIIDNVEGHTNGAIAAYYEEWIDRKQSVCRKALKLLG